MKQIGNKPPKDDPYEAADEPTSEIVPPEYPTHDWHKEFRTHASKGGAIRQ